MKQTKLQSQIIGWIQKAVEEAGYGNKTEIEVEHPSLSQYGDFSTNIALVLAKEQNKPPRELALEILNKLDLFIDKSEVINKVEIAGAGFINFFLKTGLLIKEAELINYEIEFGNRLKEYGTGKKVIIDYSAPNIAKPFGIGHLRSTNIGQAIYNLYKVLGWNTIGDNHLGDWGTQFGKLIVAIKKWANMDLEDMTIADLEKIYVKFHKEAELDETLSDEAREWFAKLENGNQEARSIWEKCIEVSLREFDRVYQMLGVNFDVAHGESFYEDKMQAVIEEMKKKGLVKNSQGAQIIEFDDLPPAILIKSNGATTYFTRDMATVKYRMDKWNPDLIIYEVGVDQQLHFKQVFKASAMMGWEPKNGFVHVAHGLIRWQTGKFSTRRGDTIHLEDVINKAIDEAQKIADKSQINKISNKDERRIMVEAVAIGAVKFNDLSQDPKRDIIFDWNKIMSLDGDSGPYLQYTYARCMSVLEKTEIIEQKNINSLPDKINNEERALLEEFYRFEEKLLESANRYSPSVLAEFLVTVARKYNEFYGKHRIINQEEEVFRVFLTRTSASILEKGLKILGIKPIDKM